MPTHKTSYPPDGVFLYHSGNELVPAYGGSGASAPRGHRTVAKGQSGAALYAALRAATLALLPDDLRRKSGQGWKAPDA